MAYIDRETALKIIDNYSKTVSEDGKVIVKAVRDIVDTICPAADVVEVVRCGQCGNYCKNTGGCNLCGIYPNENDFCSYGVRKDGDNR